MKTVAELLADCSVGGFDDMQRAREALAMRAEWHRQDAERLAAALKDLHLVSAPGMDNCLDLSRYRAVEVLAAHASGPKEGGR